jgi:hypothetical protein
MPERTIKNGSVLVTEEYELRTIDQYGDVIDVDHHDTKAAALAALEKWEPYNDEVAAVVEYHRKYHPARFGEDKFTVLARKGDAAALVEGGWDK